MNRKETKPLITMLISTKGIVYYPETVDSQKGFCVFDTSRGEVTAIPFSEGHISESKFAIMFADDSFVITSVIEIKDNTINVLLQISIYFDKNNLER